MMFAKRFEKNFIFTKQFVFWCFLRAGGSYPGGKIFPYQFRIFSHPKKHKNILNKSICCENTGFRIVCFWKNIWEGHQEEGAFL